MSFRDSVAERSQPSPAISQFRLPQGLDSPDSALCDRVRSRYRRPWRFEPGPVQTASANHNRTVCDSARRSIPPRSARQPCRNSWQCRCANPAAWCLRWTCKVIVLSMNSISHGQSQITAACKIGPERESVTPPDFMSVLDFGNSGYTREDERNRLEQSTRVAWI